MALRGREHVIDTLLEGLCAGHRILLYGPVGVGKSAILHAIAERLRGGSRPYGLITRTGSLHDVTAALAAAYPDLDTEGLKQGTIRFALRSAVDRCAPILLLDGLVAAAAPMRTFLRILEGKGAGVLIAADVAHDRDHQRVRKMRLAYREVALPPLDTRIIREQLAALVRPGLVDQLLPIVHGLPGRAHVAAALVQRPRYWSDGALLRSVLETDVDAEMARRAMTA